MGGKRKHKKRASEDEAPIPEAPESPAPDYASDDGMPVADDDDGE